MSEHVNYYDIFKKPEDLRIAALIQRRRLQILVHSCLYYHMNENIVSDKQYDTWARELQKLQEEHKEIASKVCWADTFEGYDASTGFDLPLTDEWVINKANYILKQHKEDF